MQALSKNNALSHYKWGENCDGWVFVDTPGLSVKQEHMPANTAEILHYHKQSQQFFFILFGTATFEVEAKAYKIEAGQGFYIEAGKPHRIINNTNEGLEFILSSQPSTSGDRFEAPVL